MSTATPTIENELLTLRLSPVIELTDDQLYEFCVLNRDLRIERSTKGELLIMPPTGGETGRYNSELNLQLRIWAKRDGSGETFDSSTGFLLPNGAVRAPDASWVSRERLSPLTAEQKRKFLPLCPDVVIELRSPSETINALHLKMQEYLENGARLGWFIDPEGKRVFVYRPQRQVECLENPETVSGDPILPGFELQCQEIWGTGF